MAEQNVDIGGKRVPPVGAPAEAPAPSAPVPEAEATEVELALPVEQPKRRQKGGE